MNLAKKEIIRKSEKEYRALPSTNYSSIKEYITDKRLYYRKYILGEKIEQEASYGMTLGSMVDCLLLGESGEFDNKFVVSSTIQPKGQMLEFVEKLYAITIKYMSEDGEVTQSMENLLQECYQVVAFDKGGAPIAFKGKSFEKVVELFVGDGELYYKQLRANYGKSVVTMNMVEVAQSIANELKFNKNISHIFEEIHEAHNQLPIEFNYMGYEMKMMGDRFTIDHENKIIQPYDLKVTSSSQNFGYSYLKYRYDIQAVVYRLGLIEWAKQMELDYNVAPMKFIVADSSNYYEPLIWNTSYEDFERGLNGFTIDGKVYMGVNQALEGMKWNLESGNWRTNFEDYKNNGVKALNLRYDRD